MIRTAIVIPARMGSTRFPGKPLIELEGKPMIQWVFEAALASAVSNTVVIATPDQDIISAAQSFGAEAILTKANHPSGTDRLVEVSHNLDAEYFINVQGDEPLIDPENIRTCARLLQDSSEVEMASLYAAANEAEALDPSVVKVVTDTLGFALYFSRSLIPYPRQPVGVGIKKHIGLYGYSRSVLKRFEQWPMGSLEATESLEQLRFLENGVRIKMAPGTSGDVAVDTPEQAERVRELLRERATAGWS